MFSCSLHGKKLSYDVDSVLNFLPDVSAGNSILPFGCNDFGRSILEFLMVAWAALFNGVNFGEYDFYYLSIIGWQVDASCLVSATLYKYAASMRVFMTRSGPLGSPAFRASRANSCTLFSSDSTRRRESLSRP